MPADPPAVSDDALEVKDWFQQLSQTRQSNDNGPMPITFQEIQAWVNLYSMVLSPSCIKLIRVADNAYIAAMQDEIKEDRERNSG